MKKKRKKVVENYKAKLEERKDSPVGVNFVNTCGTGR